jgi:hypothetical protein
MAQPAPVGFGAVLPLGVDASIFLGGPAYEPLRQEAIAIPSNLSSMFDFVQKKILKLGNLLVVLEKLDDALPWSYANLRTPNAMLVVNRTNAGPLTQIPVTRYFNSYGGANQPPECAYIHPVPPFAFLNIVGPLGEEWIAILSEFGSHTLMATGRYDPAPAALMALNITPTFLTGSTEEVPVGAAGVGVTGPTGVIRAVDANFLYRTGDSIHTAASVVQMENTDRIAPIYVINSCDLAIALVLTGGNKNAGNERSLTKLRQQIPSYLAHLPGLQTHNFLSFVSMQAVNLLTISDIRSTKSNGQHIALWKAAGPDGTIVPFTTLAEIQAAWQNFIAAIIAILTPNGPNDVEFFNRMMSPFYPLFTSRGPNTLSTVDIDSQVHYINSKFVLFCDQFKNPLYGPSNPAQPVLDLFENYSRTLFTVSRDDLKTVCNDYKNNVGETLKQYPINLKPADASEALIKDSALMTPNTTSTPPGDNLARNRKKRAATKAKTTALKKLKTGGPPPPAPPAPVINNAAGTSGGNSTYCVNHFAGSLTGMPADANALGCNPPPGRPACRRTHVDPPVAGTKLSKAISDDLISGVQSFKNQSFKSNFIRIVRSLV